MTTPERDDPMYAEFTDVDFSSWPYVNCISARTEINRLRRDNDLVFWFNPGGGAFVSDDRHFNCQITTCDDVLDLNILRAALAGHIKQS